MSLIGVSWIHFQKFHENRNIYSQKMAILHQIKARRALFIATPYSYVFWKFLNVGWKITRVRIHAENLSCLNSFSFDRGTNIKQFQNARIPVIVYNYSVHFSWRLVKKWRSIWMKHTPFTYIHTPTPTYTHIISRPDNHISHIDAWAYSTGRTFWEIPNTIGKIVKRYPL